MISRGLLISVGFTLLTVGLLFVYFRNKVTGIEKKVELMFNLIQNYDGQQNAMQEQYRTSPPQASPDENYPQSSVQNLKSELIEVSDDEDGDSDEVSDSENESDDDDEEEETLKFESTNIELKDHEVKTIQLEELNNDVKEEVDSLDEEDSDDEEDDDVQNVTPPGEEDEELKAEVVVELTEDDYKKKTVPALKQIASDLGLQNYRSLKKAPLIELLMSQ
jgi:hypothetical protein